MGILAVLLLGAWVIALAPALAQTVGSTSPLESELVFSRALRALGRRRRTPGGARSILVPPKPPGPHDPMSERRPGAPQQSVSGAAMRRRRNLTYLAGFIVVTFVLGLIPALRFLLVLNLIADVLLIVYLAAAMYMVVWPPDSAKAAAAPEAPTEQPSV